MCSVGYVFVEGSGRCSLFSRQHIQTFDGVIYEFPGDCSYMLAGDCQQRSFSILGKSQSHTQPYTSIKQAFTFLHLADSFIPNEIQFYQFMCSLGIKPVSLALLVRY